MRRLAALALALGACTAVTTGGGLAPSASRPAPGGEVVVPDLVGKTAEEAAALVEQAGFTGPVESSRPVECEGAPEIEGLINCQSPAAGEVVRNYTTVQINVYHATRIAGAVVRSQLLALIGMTADDARDALAGYGHDGSVRVEASTSYDESCGAGRVCGFDVPESGMGIHDPITLFIHPER